MQPLMRGINLDLIGVTGSRRTDPRQQGLRTNYVSVISQHWRDEGREAVGPERGAQPQAPRRKALRASCLQKEVERHFAQQREVGGGVADARAGGLHGRSRPVANAARSPLASAAARTAR